LQQAAWKTYLHAAFECGLLPDVDLGNRLHGIDDDKFRSGISECLTAWFFAHSGFEVKPRPESTDERNVDFLLKKSGLDIFTEVKAPCPPAGDGAPSLLKCIKDAGANQLKRGRTNLLVVCPAFDFPVHLERKQLVEATIGRVVWLLPVSLDSSPAPKGGLVFQQNGRLAHVFPDKQTGAFTTLFTRISAVMTLESQYACDIKTGAFELVHKPLVVHNPFATHRISPELFDKSIPQWVINDHGDTKTMGWNDDYSGV
jgi:hypothetical protein